MPRNILRLNYWNKKERKKVFYTEPFQISPLRKETDSKSFIWTGVKIEHTAPDTETE